MLFKGLCQPIAMEQIYESRLLKKTVDEMLSRKT